MPRITRNTLNLLAGVIRKVKDGTKYDPNDPMWADTLNTIGIAMFDAIAENNGWKEPGQEKLRTEYFFKWMNALKSDKDHDPELAISRVRDDIASITKEISERDSERDGFHVNSLGEEQMDNGDY